MTLPRRARVANPGANGQGGQNNNQQQQPAQNPPAALQNPPAAVLQAQGIFQPTIIQLPVPVGDDAPPVVTPAVVGTLAKAPK